MRKSQSWWRGVLAGVAGLSFLPAMPARADDRHASNGHESENVRRLDIMLMVTGLRCQNTSSDFQADFQAFEARHLADLNAAQHDLVGQYAAQMGAGEAEHAVDRLSVQMANRYGNGHPWLGCRELKGLAQALAGQDGCAVLVQAAAEVLDGDEPAGRASSEVSIAAR